jgi:formamidopyrimidine-DNA glycosylase
MPELPEVQTVVDHLNQMNIAGRLITTARVYWPATVVDMRADRFCETITGCTIQSISRRGKYIVFHLSHGLTMLIHLRMTGRLSWTQPGLSRSKHEHVILEVGNENELRFHDTRKFGRIILTGAPETILGKLGPEPLDRRLSQVRFEKMLQSRKRQIKPLLLDQTFLAGLGNIYVDEALWEAGIHPQRLGASLSKKEVGALHRAIRSVLQKGLENLGTSLGSGQGNFQSVGNRPGRNADALNVFRRTGAPCPRCGTMIMRIVVAQRSSHICPGCQQPSR